MYQITIYTQYDVYARPTVYAWIHTSAELPSLPSLLPTSKSAHDKQYIDKMKQKITNLNTHTHTITVSLRLTSHTFVRIGARRHKQTRCCDAEFIQTSKQINGSSYIVKEHTSKGKYSEHQLSLSFAHLLCNRLSIPRNRDEPRICEERRFFLLLWFGSVWFVSALHLLRWWMRHLWISRQRCFFCFCFVSFCFALSGYHLPERLALMWIAENMWEPWCSINSKYHAIAQKYDWQNNRLMRARSLSQPNDMQEDERWSNTCFMELWNKSCGLTMRHNSKYRGKKRREKIQIRSASMHHFSHHRLQSTAPLNDRFFNSKWSWNHIDHRNRYSCLRYWFTMWIYFWAITSKRCGSK